MRSRQLDNLLAVRANATTSHHKDDEYKGFSQPQYWAEEVVVNIEEAAPDIFMSNGMAVFG